VIDISDNVYNSPIDVSHSNNSNTSSPVRDTQVAMVLPDSSVAPELMKRGVWTKTEFRVPEDYDTFTGKGKYLISIYFYNSNIRKIYLLHIYMAHFSCTKK